MIDVNSSTRQHCESPLPQSALRPASSLQLNPFNGRRM